MKPPCAVRHRPRPVSPRAPLTNRHASRIWWRYPELASRDHVRRALPLLKEVLTKANVDKHIDAIAFTEGPGLAGALLVGCRRLRFSFRLKTRDWHSPSEWHCSPLLASRPPEFPFVALLVSGGHTQLMRVDGVGRYELLGETLDDAAGEAFGTNQPNS